MKIRIKGNSIRYRLDQSDTARLQETGKVEEHTWIGATPLHFCIRSRDNFSEPAIKWEGSGIHLGIPSPYIHQWLNTDQTGMEFELNNPDNSHLKLLIEKDFKCLTERGEDESQAFENPHAGKNC